MSATPTSGHDGVRVKKISNSNSIHLSSFVCVMLDEASLTSHGLNLKAVGIDFQSYISTTNMVYIVVTP